MQNSTRIRPVSLARIALASAAALVTLGFTTLPAFAAGDDCPDGGTKIDESGPASFSCGEGQVLTGICVKAGRVSYGVGDGAAPGGEGCYVYEGLGQSSGSVSGGGTGSDCKAISHKTYYCGPGEPPSEPVCGDGVVEGTEECDPPGPLGEGLTCSDTCEIVEPPSEPVCGDGVIEGTEECDPPGMLGEGLACNESCQIVESPTEPVCGNGVIEAGEDCDPPGALGEGLVCDESCQVTTGGEGGCTGGPESC